MSKYLVTGGGGFVASHLVDLLLSKNEDVAITCRWNEDLSRIVHFKDKVYKVYMDLNDEISILRSLMETKPSYICHLAAESYVNYGYEVPIQTINTNTLGTVRLFEAVRFIKEFIDPEFNPTIISVSSSEYYGKVDEDEIPITEMNEVRAGNQYAIGKIGGDVAARFYHKYYGLNIIRTRLFSHVGWGRTMLSAECNFARQIAKIELGLQEPVIKHGNLESVRTWSDVRDAVRAYYVLFEKGIPGEVYNVGGTTQKTVGEMLDYMLSLSGVKGIKKELDPNLVRKVDVNLQVVDYSKFAKATGWGPEISFEETISSVLSFWRQKIKQEHGAI